MLNDTSGMISGSCTLDNGPLLAAMGVPANARNRYLEGNIQEWQTPSKGPVRAMNHTQEAFPSGQKSGPNSPIRLHVASGDKFQETTSSPFKTDAYSGRPGLTHSVDFTTTYDNATPEQ